MKSIEADLSDWPVTISPASLNVDTSGTVIDRAIFFLVIANVRCPAGTSTS